MLLAQSQKETYRLTLQSENIRICFFNWDLLFYANSKNPILIFSTRVAILLHPFIFIISASHFFFFLDVSEIILEELINALVYTCYIATYFPGLIPVITGIKFYFILFFLSWQFWHGIFKSFLLKCSFWIISSNLYMRTCHD